MSLLKRQGYLDRVKRMMRQFGVTALVGARQTGKTTLAREIVRGLEAEGVEVHYYDMERPAHLRALDEAELALEGLKGVVVIDEVQRRPDLFPILRVLVDRRPMDARFLVLGSASGELMRQTSESLAGRIGYVELPGFGVLEVEDMERLWVRGGFPDSYLAEDEEASYLWREQFMRTFLERDIPSFGIGVEPMQLWRFWQMAAHYHGQVWNHSEIGRSLQVDYKTVKRYLDILTDTFMVRQLVPWYENVGKRTVKAPKFYVRDSGLLNVLLGLGDMGQLRVHPKLGASWEGFAVEQVVQMSGVGRHVYYWAAHGGGEVDLVLPIKGKRIGVEFKYADAPSATKSMYVARDCLKLDRLIVVYPGDTRYEIGDDMEVVPLSEVGGVLTS